MKRLTATFVVVACVVLAAASARAAVSWSDNFNGGAQQTWTVHDYGLNSTATVTNNQYQLHTEKPTGAPAGAIVSLVESASFTDSVVQARVQEIASGDHFLAYLMARADPTSGTAYVLGIGSPGGGNQAHLWLGKLLNSGYISLLGLDIQPSFNYADCQAEFSVIGNTLKGKVWTTGTAEPDWLITTTDSSYASGYDGVMLATYPTLGWNSVSVAFDDVTATAIPEPATFIVWSLLGLTAAGFGLWRRNRP